MANGEGALEVDAWQLLRRLGFAVLAVEAVLTVIDFLFAYLDLIPSEAVQHLANLAREDGIGTWFSSTQAFCVGLAVLAIGLVEKATARPAWWGWMLIAAFFTYIAFDDAIEVHERLGSAVRRLTQSEIFDVFPTYAWQLVFGPLFGGMGLFIVIFLWRRLADPRLRLGIGVALTCFVVAVGFDFVEGVEGAFEGMATAIGVRNYTVSHGFKVTEEVLEMLGTTAFLVTFLWQLALTLADRPVIVRATPRAGTA
jgi:hypothetical protein